MKEFLTKHIEEISGTIIGFLTGVGIKFNTALVAVALLNDLHVIVMSFITGAVGGVGALSIKLLYNWFKKKRNGTQ